MANKMRWSVAPYFIVDDVVATANFYRDKLGFHYERLWGEPPASMNEDEDGVQRPVTDPKGQKLTRCRLSGPTGKFSPSFVAARISSTLVSFFSSG